MADRTVYRDNALIGLKDHVGDESVYSVEVWMTGGSINSPGITQYTEGDIDASITGTAVMWEDAANTLRSVSAAKPLPVSMQTPLDSAAFTPTTDPYMPVGGEFDDAAPAGLAEGQGGAVRLSNRREMYVTIRDAAGNERGLNIDAGGNLAVTVPGDYPEDSPHNNEDVGLFVLTVRNDSGSVMSGTDGDYTPFMVDANGRLYVKNDALDKDADEVLVWANTAKDGTGTDYVPLVDSDGHLQVDVLSAVVNSGSVDVLSLPADTFVAEDGALGKGVLIQGDDGTDRHNLQTDASGYLKTIAQANNGVDIGDVDIATIAAGETHVGEVHTNSAQVDVTPTITAGAYSIGDVIGGIQTLTNAARVSGQATTLDTLAISDKAMQDADLKIWFFNQNPTSGSYDDNDALDIDDTDLGYWIGTLRILSSDYDDATDNSGATLRNIGLKLTPSGSANLFAIAEVETADTYASTSDLTFKYSFDR